MKVVHVLRKPCSEGTVAANVLRWGTGALNIDATRISATDAFGGGAKATSGFVNGYAADGWVPGSPLGRWPANLVLQHLDGCVQGGTRKVKGQNPQYASDGKGETGLHVYNRNNRIWGTRPARTGIGHADPDGTETVTAWACGAGCPVAGLDAQSGDLHIRGNIQQSASGGGSELTVKPGGEIKSNHHLRPELNVPGGASRFFKQVGGKVCGEE